MIGETTDPIATVGAATFDADVLAQPGPAVVEFMSFGCSHCRALEPVLRDVAAAVASRVRIVRVNVAVEQDLAEAYDIRVTPTLVMFRDGRQIGRVEGPQPNVASLTETVTRPFASDGVSG